MTPNPAFDDEYQRELWLAEREMLRLAEKGIVFWNPITREWQFHSDVRIIRPPEDTDDLDFLNTDDPLPPAA